MNNIIKSKGEDIIYFLTDITEEEKQLIFEYLDQNADDSNEKEILEILEKVYLDLFYYLSPFWFDNGLLDEYFQKYKYQKVANKIFPEFKELVEKQALQREFNLLPARSSKIEEIERENTALYFIDALGVEFLSYITEKCKENNLLTVITVCVCELPSLTRPTYPDDPMHLTDLGCPIFGRMFFENLSISSCVTSPNDKFVFRDSLLSII